jgi:hypothetical protein
MALPIDTRNLTVLCGNPPAPVVDRDTGEHRTTRDGLPLFRTELVVMGQGRPEVLGVRTVKDPKGLGIGTPVTVTAFTISTFTTRDGTTGVFYEAGAIEPTRAAEPTRTAKETS